MNILMIINHHSSLLIITALLILGFKIWKKKSIPSSTSAIPLCIAIIANAYYWKYLHTTEGMCGGDQLYSPIWNILYCGSSGTLILIAYDIVDEIINKKRKTPNQGMDPTESGS